MDDLTFDNLDKYLLSQNSKIIHQVWFDNILRSKKETRKSYEKLRVHRDTWLLKNPSWTYICWNVEKSEQLIRTCYPHHLEMYKKYTYPIQRCDVIRYFFLHRYGGLYADMDYHCNKSWSFVVEDFPNDFYLVETPNKIHQDDLHVSNSLMYSLKGHIFWSILFIELEIHKDAPIYYSKHLAVMFTTGPGILNRVFNKYRVRYKLGHYPYNLFHPYGLDKVTNQEHIIKDELYAYHLGKGSWESSDSKMLIFFYVEWKIIFLIIFGMVLPSIIYRKIMIQK